MGNSKRRRGTGPGEKRGRFTVSIGGTKRGVKNTLCLKKGGASPKKKENDGNAY